MPLGPAVLSDADVERYSRQILLPEVGGRGQERLLRARVGIVVSDVAARDTVLLGALHLAVAGIGEIVFRPSTRAAGLAGDLEAIAHRRAPDAAITTGTEPADVELGFDAIPGDGPPWVALLSTPTAVGVLTSSSGAVCDVCATAMRGALGDVEAELPASAPLLGSLAATAVLRLLLDLGGDTPPLLLDVERLAPVSLPAAAHECSARRRS